MHILRPDGQELRGGFIVRLEYFYGLDLQGSSFVSDVR